MARAFVCLEAVEERSLLAMLEVSTFITAKHIGKRRAYLASLSNGIISGDI